MRDFLRHLPDTDRVRYAFVALLLTLVGVVSIYDGSLRPGTAQAALTARTTASMVTHETETIDNYEAEEVAGASVGYMHPAEVPVLPPEQIDAETLWLARCLYSETKRPEEQELVAWAIRNRVETGYRGERTYRDVVLDRYQFSAFNPNSRKRSYFTGLTPYSEAEGWQRTLSIAKMVKDAPASLRPFSQTTRHYFSQRSMVGGGFPHWARGASPVTPERDYRIAAERFRFYDGIR